jgi:hypothetical protein
MNAAPDFGGPCISGSTTVLHIGTVIEGPLFDIFIRRAGGLAGTAHGRTVLAGIDHPRQQPRQQEEKQ